MKKVKVLRILIIIAIWLVNFGCDSKGEANPVKESENLKTEEITISTNENNQNGENQEIFENTRNKIPEDLLIEFIDRCPGFQFCLTYKLTINADGSVLFEDKRNKKANRRIKSEITIEKVKLLVREFEKADFFNLADKYSSDTCPIAMTEGWNVYTSIQINDRKKSVSHYLGCGYGINDVKNPLFKLTELENKIREISGAKRWIGERK